MGGSLSGNPIAIKEIMAESFSYAVQKAIQEHRFLGLRRRHEAEQD